MPTDLGMMLNDRLGDCTCAAIYHGIQVWAFNAQQNINTEQDPVVLKAYELICGYNPNDPSTDQGGIIQHVLKYWAKTGAPMAHGTQRCSAFLEVDPSNAMDVNSCIADCGLVYIGLTVPAYILPPDGEPPQVWDVDENADNTIIGGHAVVVPGFQANNTRKIISWGSYYEMTEAFWNEFVDECYCIADSKWIQAKGTTPAGLSLQQLEAQMRAIVNG
jgi:hypothetical protein